MSNNNKRLKKEHLNRKLLYPYLYPYGKDEEEEDDDDEEM